MKLANKNILIISPEAWSNMMVSKHHYATHLSKNNHVYFLNPPSQSTQLIQIKEQLSIIDYQQKFRGLQYLPKWINAFITKKEIQNIEQFIDSKIEVVWNFDPSRFFNLSKVKAIRICHIVDWNQEFQRKTLAKTTDICFSTNSYLVKELAKYNQNSYFINHGYCKRTLSEVSIPAYTKQTTHVGYVGNLNIKYIDWDLMLEIVSSNPTVQFYFFGPYDLHKAEIKMKEVFNCSNSYFTGKVDATLVPSYLAKMDILLLVYKADQYPMQLANPHKMLEYMGSGNCIVSTYTHEYKNKGELIVMSEKNKDLPNLLGETLSNLSTHNSTTAKSNRINFARSNDYNLHLQQIEEYIHASVPN